MKQRINQYIPIALEGIKQNLANLNDEVDERYDGYTASMGPAIITSGLKQAIAFYTDLHRGTEAGPRRHHILKIITHILVSEGEAIQNAPAENSLLIHLMTETNNTQQLKEKILDAVVALKLAFRNFKQVKQ